MSENTNLMSEFRKLQSETTGIHSQFSANSSFDTAHLIGNKLSKDVYNLCEKTTELHDKFNQEVMNGMKMQKTAMDGSVNEILEELKSMRGFNKEIVEKMDLLSEKQTEQKKLANELFLIKANQEQSNREILEEMKSMRRDIEVVKQQVSEKNITKSVTIDDNKEMEKSREEEEKPKTKYYEKEFVIRHVFKDLSKRNLSENQYSQEEEHFNNSWSVYFRVNKNVTRFYLKCVPKNQDITITTLCELKLISTTGQIHMKFVNGKFTNLLTAKGFSNFAPWADVEKDYVSNDKLIVEAHVIITKMTGVYKPNVMNFDESMKPFSDVLLTINHRKFYIYKLLHLAPQSAYFKSLKDNLEASNQSEITITVIDPDDFQVFLEVLYGEAIAESTVEICLLHSERFGAPIITKRCEEFLMNGSEKTLKTKLRLAVRYKLEKLKKKCISEIETIDNIRDVVPGDVRDLDHSILADLFEKSISF